MNCQYCHNKIFETDRFCPSCGAPNYNNDTQHNGESYGAFIKMLEQVSPCDYLHDGYAFENREVDTYFKKYITEPLRKFITGVELTE